MSKCCLACLLLSSPGVSDFDGYSAYLFATQEGCNAPSNKFDRSSIGWMWPTIDGSYMYSFTCTYRSSLPRTRALVKLAASGYSISTTKIFDEARSLRRPNAVARHRADKRDRGGVLPVGRSRRRGVQAAAAPCALRSEATTVVEAAWRCRSLPSTRCFCIFSREAAAASSGTAGVSRHLIRLVYDRARVPKRVLKKNAASLPRYI